MELLIATAVASLLLTLLLTVFSGALESWTTTSARSETFGEGRAALYLLERELGTMAPKISDAPVRMPDVVTGLETPTGQVDEALGFLCEVPPQGQPSASAQSDVCAVTYFLAPISDVAGAPHALFRRLTPSSDTFAMLGKSPAGYFKDLCVVDALAEVIAQNVIQFKVRQRGKDMEIISPTVPPTAPEEAAYVEIVLKVISSRAAQSYFDPATPAFQREKIALREAREFTLRHPLR